VAASAWLTVACSAQSDPVPESNESVFTVPVEVELAEIYTTAKDIAQAERVAAIVAGVVVETRDVWIDGPMVFRLLTIDVSQVLAGQTPQRITVRESGGLMDWDDFLKAWGPKTADLPANPPKYYEESWFGADHTAVGDELVLFLGTLKDDPQWRIADEDYDIVGGIFGRYTLDKEAALYRRAVGADPEEVGQMFSDWTLTYDQLQDAASTNR
jgi:hypothetical protein